MIKKYFGICLMIIGAILFLIGCMTIYGYTLIERTNNDGPIIVMLFMVFFLVIIYIGYTFFCMGKK